MHIADSPYEGLACNTRMTVNFPKAMYDDVCRAAYEAGVGPARYVRKVVERVIVTGCDESAHLNRIEEKLDRVLSANASCGASVSRAVPPAAG